MCHMNKYGFPRTSAKAAKIVHGFQTGDIVKAIIPNGKYAGTHVGRVAVRTRGSFAICSGNGKWFDTSHKNCGAVHKMDGYSYQRGEQCA